MDAENQNLEEALTQKVQDIQEQIDETTEQIEDAQTDQPKPEVSEYDKGKQFAEQGAKKSIRKLVSQKKMLEHKLEQLMNQNQEILEQFSQLKQPQAPPKYEDFQNSQNPDYAYFEAMDEYKKSKQQAKPAKTAPASTDIDQELAARFTAQESQFMQKNPDYLESRQSLMPFLQGNNELINLLHEAGPEVVNYLGENLEIADELSGMSPARMGRYLATIENQLKKPTPTPRQIKKQPDPINNVRSSGRGVKNINDMTQSEYNAFMADPKNWT